MERPSASSGAIDLARLRSRMQGKVILFMGAPGAGKGTQAKILSEQLGIPHISTGDLFREEARSGSALGKEIAKYQARGEFVPADIANQLLLSRLSREDARNGFILDGFPRSENQADDLEGILKRIGRQVDYAIHVDVRRGEVLERLGGRRICTDCGVSVRVAGARPRNAANCEHCGLQLTQRPDDQPEVVTKRLDAFESQTIPVIDRYFRSDALYRVDGMASPDQVNQRILESLGDASGGPGFAPTAFERFKESLGNPSISGDDGALGQVVLEFRNRSLQENLHKRTGNKRRFVFALTSSNDKYREFVKYFDQYGIEVLKAPPVTDERVLTALLRSGDEDLVPLAVLREETSLFRPGSRVPSSMRNGVEADHFSELQAYWLEDGKLSRKTYQDVTRGKIDLSKIRERHPVYGWDDAFIVKSTGLSYQEMKDRGLKVSSRENVLSDFTRDKIHYGKKDDLRFNPQRLSRAMAFDRGVEEIFFSDPRVGANPIAASYGIHYVLNQVANDGFAVRGADKRRLRNYWSPGLNGGLPLTPKSDDIHELTFRMHDAGHFLVPDLIFAGVDSPAHRQAYIAYRMISEASTLVFADMLFVDSLRRSGIPYDYAKRRIYPLFQDLGIDLSNKAEFIPNVKRMMKAVVRYTLKGDDSLLREMVSKNGKSLENLEKFKEKYMPFFVEDFRWTEQNYDHMVKSSEAMRRWIKEIEPIRRQPGLKMETVDDFLASLKPGDGDIVDQVFETVFERNIRPALEGKVEPQSSQERLRKAFSKYMAGQMAIFSKFHFIPDTAAYRSKILDLLNRNADSLDLGKVEEIRGVYEEYLALLQKKRLISKDDLATYREAYPLFDPFYVSYDKGSGQYEDLAAISQRVLDGRQHWNKQLEARAQLIGKTPTEKEARYLRRMATLVEKSGGQVEEGLFVTKPGVMLLSENLV